MTNHLTDIELFEYANEMIADTEQLSTLKEHISTCKDCQLKLKSEKRVDAVLKKELAVEQQIDVRQSVLYYFEKPAVKVIGVDVSWMIVMVLFISALLIVGELSAFNEKIPQLRYATLIASAVSSLLIVDFFLKYRKNKKNATS